MRLTPFLGMDELGQPIDPRRAERRAEIARQMRCVAKASESALPADERRGAYVPGDDPVELTPVREAGRAMYEYAVSCACMAPIAFGLVFYWMTHL